jgi:putative phage-type endonuclease
MTITLEQLKARKEGIGGSDAAAILGISKWSTPLDVFFNKTNAEVEEQALTPAQEWGNRLEPVIIQKFQDATGLQCKTSTETFKHKEYPFMLANIDAFIPEENAVLEIKTANTYAAKEWSMEGGDNLPDYYLTQCAHYAEVLGVEKVYVAVLIGGSDFRVYNYNRTPRLQQAIIEKEHNFWHNNVLKHIPPEPVTIEDSLKLWQLSGQDVTKVAGDEQEALIAELWQIKEQTKELEDLYKDKSKTLFTYFQDAEALVDRYGNKLATWKSQAYTRLDMERLKAECQDIYKKYLKQSQTRVFRMMKPYA